MTQQINKAPELLLAGEVLDLFIQDCLVTSKEKHVPFGLIEQMLKLYCTYLGVRPPSPKQLGAALTNKYPKQLLSGNTTYQCGINPTIVDKRETNHD